ncbi:MAG: SDR family NAD(P)-dependent oxidoreductase [Epsilonproteobacteria bacterium]|nr:SDR family NAD(P)-dependent oxidoreductase [Campylobacterota bacterium]
MNNFLKNKRALITGASSGIGEAVAFELIKYKVDLVLSARDMDKLKKLKGELLKKDSNINIELIALDVRDKEQVKESFSNIDVDILINSAGLALGFEPLDKGDFEDWDIMIDTNIKGLLYVTKLILSKMREKNSGHIVNLGSVAGKVAYPNGGVYCATKAAVHSLGESLNADLFGTNIKVSTIAPGAVETNFSNIRFKGDKNRAKDVYKGFIPLSAKDIADAIICILNTPPHVNIQYMDIMPTAQRNPFMLYKEEE